ncbi:MAG: hypothetical protein ACYTA3_06965 [Planctomycetota bacterium]|jgi:hypothetical protein
MSQDAPTPSESDLLQSLLASRDIACPVCAYNLRGSESSNCPECGANLDLRVGSTDLKLGPWLTAILGLAFPLGFVSIYAIFGLVAMLVFAVGGGGVSGGPSLLVSMSVPTLICAAYAFLLWRLVRRRRKFWAKSRRAQWRSAVLYAVLGPGPVLAPLVVALFLL